MKGALAALTARWCEDASVLRRCGDERGAQTCETHAAQLEAAWRAYLFEPLSIEVAVQESGYSASRLYSLVESGALENAGRPGAPLIRRVHLPRKARAQVRGSLSADSVAIVDAALSEMRKGR